MTKFKKSEWWILLLTLVFLLGTIGYFMQQNQERELSYVVVEHPPEHAASPPQEADSKPQGILEGERININTAPTEDLMRLPGIGATRAADIVAYRTQKGPFKALEDIMDISGIGEKTYEKLTPYICIADN